MPANKTVLKKEKKREKDIPQNGKLPKEERLLRSAAKHVSRQIQQLQNGIGVQSSSYKRKCRF